MTRDIWSLRERHRATRLHFVHGVPQTKFAASFVSPEPLYFATWGYAQSGLVIFTTAAAPSPDCFVAMTVVGAVPFSTHCSSARYMLCCGSFAVLNPIWPNTSGPGPPPQCCRPGTMNKRRNESASCLPILP